MRLIDERKRRERDAALLEEKGADSRRPLAKPEALVDAMLGAATGYAQQGSGLRRAPDWNMSVAGAAGALYSTVDDLARWNDAVFGGKVLSKASLAAAFAPVQVGASPPGEEGYGYGWNIGRLRGVREIGHGGGLPGFVSHLVRYPDDGLTVAVLVNSAPTPPALDPGQIGRAVAQLYLADRMESRRRPAAISLPPEALERFAGRYDYGRRLEVPRIE